MGKDRLLERIRAQNKDLRIRRKEGPKEVIDSILQHLQRILNTRQGSVPIAEDFGIPDLTELRLDYPDSLRLFERAIRQTIQKFEPRLSSLRVRFVPDEEDPLSLRFQILGKLQSEGYKDPVRFESTVGSDGKIIIKR
ncbi:MAG: type VI secretion system baseplate subunit TssE [Desulfatiglandaceae bacterium]